MEINIDEIRVQVALGTINEEIRSSIWQIDDKEVLKVLSECTEIPIRKAVAVNPHTPFSVIKKLYTSDPDLIVRECAWDRVAMRFMQCHHLSFPPPLPDSSLEPSFDDLPDGVNIYRS